MSTSAGSSELIVVLNNSKGTRRGRKIVKGGDLVCSACHGSPSFQTKKEMADHKNKVHRFVKCGGCEPKKIITFSSYKQTHIRAFPKCRKVLPTPWNKEDQCEAGWMLPEDFRNIIASETLTKHDDNVNADQQESETGGTEMDHDDNEEGHDMAELSDDEELHYTEASVSSSANDGTCDVDEAFTAQDIMKYDRMTKKRPADVSNENEFPIEKRCRQHPEPGSITQVSSCDVVGTLLASKQRPTSMPQGATEETENCLIRKIKLMYEQEQQLLCNVTLMMGKAKPVSSNNKDSVKVCRNIMEMWKCWNGCKMGDMIYTGDFTCSVDTLRAVLLFLHTGSGIIEADLLLKFLNDSPTKLVSLYIVLMLILSSLNCMSDAEFQKVARNLFKLDTCEFVDIIKLCLMWKVICSVVLGKTFPRSSALELEAKELFKRICGRDIDDHDNPRCSILIMNCVQHETIACAKKFLTEEARISRCMEYNASVASQSFQFQLLYNYLLKGEDNILHELFADNVDPFCSELDECFHIYVDEQNDSLTLYIHQIVLGLRLGIEQNCLNKTLVLIRKELTKGKRRKKTFQVKDVLQFWRFLYTDKRSSSWQENHSVESIINLSVTFKVENVPMFLFNANEPENASMMKYFLKSYLLIDDDLNIARMCRLLLQDASLIAKLKTNEVYKIFVKDCIPLTEMDLYGLVVTFSHVTPLDDESQEYSTFNGRFQRLCTTIRFGLMNEKEFEKVDEDGHLDPNLCSAFFYNIKRKPNSTRFAEIPDDFIKPFEPRKN